VAEYEGKLGGVSRANSLRKGTKYHIQRRDLAQKKIRRLIIDLGLTNRQIAERLKIPEKTIERYIRDLYAQDNKLIQSLNSDEEVITAWLICKDRMDHHRQEILETIARNSEASFMEKIKAWHLICELEAADLRIRNETAPLVARRSASQVRRAMMLKEEEQVKEWKEEENEKVSTEISQTPKNQRQEEEEDQAPIGTNGAEREDYYNLEENPDGPAEEAG
jgi:transcriptional regulator with XRE-family HTH domain